MDEGDGAGVAAGFGSAAAAVAGAEGGEAADALLLGEGLLRGGGAPHPALSPEGRGGSELANAIALPPHPAAPERSRSGFAEARSGREQEGEAAGPGAPQGGDLEAKCALAKFWYRGNQYAGRGDPAAVLADDGAAALLARQGGVEGAAADREPDGGVAPAASAGSARHAGRAAGGRGGARGDFGRGARAGACGTGRGAAAPHCDESDHDETEIGKDGRESHSEAGNQEQ